MTSHLPLGLDATYILDPQPTGVSVYSRELLFGLAQLEPGLPLRAYYRPHRFRRAVQDSVPASVSRRVLTDWIAPSVDLFHGLNQRLPKKLRGRSAVTFHDLFVMTGEYSTPEFRERFTQFSRDAAHRADLIVAISEFTASQVSSLLNVERSRIRVIPHGVHVPESSRTAINCEKIILHVGAIQARKNVIRLVEAFEQMADDWRLVLAGGAGYGSEAILERISRSPKTANIQVTGYLSNRALEAIYNQASILAFPSLDEGFGIPILEAMARGVPVVTSNRSATAEVAGDAAILVNPLDAGELAAALVRVASDNALRRKLAQLGLERVQNFSWEAAVRKTRQVYRELGV